MLLVDYVILSYIADSLLFQKIYHIRPMPLTLFGVAAGVITPLHGLVSSFMC